MTLRKGFRFALRTITLLLTLWTFVVWTTSALSQVDLPRTSIVNVIVPCRQREEHLRKFLDEFAPLLKLHLVNVRLTFVEQSNDDKLFNRGKLLNVGVNESGKDVSHVILHDIDTFASESCIRDLYSYHPQEEEIIRIYVGHDESLGGICRFSTEAFHQVNGFPNAIYGWGVEDRALYHRARIKNVSMSENYSRKYSFTSLSHVKNVAVYSGKMLETSDQYRERLISTLEERDKHLLVESDGLTTLNYSIVERRVIQQYIEHLLVEI